MIIMKRLLPFILLISLLTACATSPTGRHQLMLVSEESAIASSKQAYLSTVKQLDDAGKLEENWVINKRIEVITGQLITEAIKMRPDTANWEWSVVVIDDPKTINAWCMAGGRMAVYTGLIKQLDPTDDELAQVMAIPVKVRKETIWVRTDIPSNAASLIKAIGMKIPPKIIAK